MLSVHFQCAVTMEARALYSSGYQLTRSLGWLMFASRALPLCTGSTPISISEVLESRAPVGTKDTAAIPRRPPDLSSPRRWLYCTVVIPVWLRAATYICVQSCRNCPRRHTKLWKSYVCIVLVIMDACMCVNRREQHNNTVMSKSKVTIGEILGRADASPTARVYLTAWQPALQNYITKGIRLTSCYVLFSVAVVVVVLPISPNPNPNRRFETEPRESWNKAFLENHCLHHFPEPLLQRK